MNAPTPRHPLKFFILTLLLATPFWIMGGFVGLQLLPGIPVSALWIVCPLIAALILSYQENKTAGMAALLRRTFDYARIKSGIWYLPMVLLYPGMTMVEYGLLRLSGSPIPLPQFSFLAPLPMFLLFFVAGVSEELGWMGYAIDPMQERMGAFKASILLGLIWGAFHIIPIAQVGQPFTWIAWQFCGIAAGRVLFVWLYNNTGKSVFAMAVLHAMLNVSWQLFPINGSFYDPRMNALVVSVVAILVTLAWGPRTLAHYKFAQSH